MQMFSIWYLLYKDFNFSWYKNSVDAIFMIKLWTVIHLWRIPIEAFAHLKVTAFNLNMWNPVELLSVAIPKSMQKISEKITIVTEGK